MKPRRYFWVLYSIMVTFVFFVTGNANEREWLFMFYFAGQNDLEVEALNDFVRLAKTGSTDDVALVTLLDRSVTHDTRYGDWSGTRRGIIEKGATPVENWGESVGNKNMADPSTLKEFVIWSVANYPAKKKALVIWNHGYGLLGMCMDMHEGKLDYLELEELREALQGTGEFFDVLGFMICNGAMIELASYVSPFTNTFTASEERIETPETWPMDLITNSLVSKPLMSGPDLGKTIVERFADYHAGNSGTHTMGSIDVSNYNNSDQSIISALNGLVEAIFSEASVDLYNIIDTLVWKKGFGVGSIFASDVGVMLSNFAQCNQLSSLIRNAAQKTLDIYNNDITIAYDRGKDNPQYSGLCIYWPHHGLETLYQGKVAYCEAAHYFTSRCLWDEFLEWFGKKGEQDPLGINKVVYKYVPPDHNSIPSEYRLFTIDGKLIRGYSQNQAQFTPIIRTSSNRTIFRIHRR